MLKVTFNTRNYFYYFVLFAKYLLGTYNTFFSAFDIQPEKCSPSLPYYGYIYTVELPSLLWMY